jgi:hypothetical protein
MHLPVRIAVALAIAAVTGQGFAGTVEYLAPDNLFSVNNAIDPASLDGYRGGFVTDTGIAVTLGIERIVTINGNLAEHSQLNLGDLGRLTSGATRLNAEAAGQLRLIQNGGGKFDVQMGNTLLGGTVIQNSLNNQMISNQTIINANVNARGLLQAMNFQQTLSGALNTAATGR